MRWVNIHKYTVDGPCLQRFKRKTDMCMITYKIVPVQSSSVQNAVILMKGMKKVFLEESMGFQKGKIIERVKGSV